MDKNCDKCETSSKVIEEQQILKNKLDIYFELKKQLKCNIAIVGSTALYLQGFQEFICLNKDLDLVAIDPTNEDLKVLQSLKNLSPNQKLSKVEEYNRGNTDNFFLKLNNIEVDIFSIGVEKIVFEKEFIEIINPVDRNFQLDLQIILISTLPRIMGIKKKYNRKKDWDFIFKIAHWLKEGFDINNLKN